jgi:spore coat polysaccharide biosynthesis predicted glycosyltransferase SpsG
LSKILIFPSGLCSEIGEKLTQYGRGHAIRCLSLARNIRQIEPSIQIIFAASGEEYTLCEKSEFDSIKLPLVASNSSLQDEIRKVKFEINLMRFHEPDLIISDTHKEAIIAARYVGIPCVAICDLPPIGFFPITALHADLILIPHLEQITEIPDFFCRESEKIKVIGPIFGESPLEENDIEKLQKKMQLDSFSLIVAYSSRISTDAGDYLKLLIDAFRMLNKEHVPVKLVIIGPGLSVRACTPDIQGLMIYSYVKNMMNYIKVSDIFVTRSCISAMESMAYGIPTIMIPIRGDVNQETIAGRFGSLRALLNYGIESLTPQILKKKIQLLLEDSKLRKNMATISKNIIDGSSGKRAAELIVDFMKVDNNREKK